MFLRAICVFVLLGILVAGLWPFHAPKNEVSWLSGESGLLFGKYSSIVSAGTFKADGQRRAADAVWRYGCSRSEFILPARSLRFIGPRAALSHLPCVNPWAIW